MEMSPASEAPPIPLIGYSDKLSGRAGDAISFKVSCTSTTPFTARLVRIICGDPNPAGPGMIEEDVESEFAGTYPSREQPFFPGSYVVIEKPLPLTSSSTVTVQVSICPTLPGKKTQAVLSLGELWLGLDEDGRLCAGMSGGNTVCTADPLLKKRWYTVRMIASPVDKKLRVEYAEVVTGKKQSAEGSLSGSMGWGHPVFATIGARMQDGLACSHFNGKIEGPTLWEGEEGSAEPVASWDFSIGISSTAVTDTGRHALNGRIVNLPARGVTSSKWDGSEMCFTHKPEHYNAIHFHDDDIYDFGWETDFAFTIPADLPSGVYAARISCGEAYDAIPFFVCAPKGQRRADLCVLMSTFTYVVYGNHARPDFGPEWHSTVGKWQAYPYNPAEYRHYGLSTYNLHSDGSGICHASHRRPLLNLRPGYRTFAYGESSGLRHLQADTHLIAWLHHLGVEYDVITDQELHDEGVEALAGYKCVTTGSHPEYHTGRMLDALERYRDTGGKLCYLGGNGFYWRVALHSEEAQHGAIEIRRGEGGIRAWAAESGEYYNAFDGGYGGLWRRNGRPPQALVGVGFSTQGEFQGTYYRLKVDATDAEVGWAVEGIEGDRIGDFGLSGGGAAGFELDRLDESLGTPGSVRVIARSEAHPTTFVLVPEEILTHLTTVSGEKPADLLRADMVYFEVRGGGAVFATGSITFCGSLPCNNFANNVSTLLSNVLARFGVRVPRREAAAVKKRKV